MLIWFLLKIILHSLHRYQPRLHVIEARDVLRWSGGQHTFVFPETQFITVTAYQNNKVWMRFNTKDFEWTEDAASDGDYKVSVNKQNYLFLSFLDHRAEDQLQPLRERLQRRWNEQQKVILNKKTCTKRLRI